MLRKGQLEFFGGSVLTVTRPQPTLMRSATQQYHYGRQPPGSQLVIS